MAMASIVLVGGRHYTCCHPPNARTGDELAVKNGQGDNFPVAHFKTLNMIPQFKGRPAKVPSLRRYAALHQQLKKTFFRQFLKGQAGFEMELERPPFKTLNLHVTIVDQTAAMVELGRVSAKGPADRTPELHGLCLLLAGFRDADHAMLNAIRQRGAKEQVEFCPPAALDAAEAGPRPLMVNVALTPEAVEDPLFHIACVALADAFFDQLGQSGDPSEPLPPPVKL